MIPYGQHEIREQDLEAVRSALTNDKITQGPLIGDFEEKLCSEFNCKHAVVVNNGTTALELAYSALGVEDGTEVLTSPNTFVATSNAVVRNGGVPRFVDIDPETYNLDVDALEAYLDDPARRENLIGLTSVHFAGLPCNMEKIHELAEQYDLFVLEDACHAPGAEWKDSQGNWHKVGSCSHSDAAVLSFHPVKHFTTGEGGAVLTNSEKIAKKVKQLRHHGITQDQDKFTRNPDGPWYYEMQDLGVNGRITDIQCALGISQLNRLDEMVEKRRNLANDYNQHFADLQDLKIPKNSSDTKHAYHLYVVQFEQRDSFYEYLESNDIYPQVHYIPVHLQPFYQTKFSHRQGDFPIAEEYYSQALSLPMFPAIEENDYEHVVETVKSYFEGVYE